METHAVGPSDRRLSTLWAIALAGPAALQLLLSTLLPTAWTLVAPTTLFVIVVIAASLCAVTAGLVLIRAWKRDEPELAWLGLFFWAVSVLPLVHGITTPGVLFGDNTATMSSVLWSIPVALAVSFPAYGPARVVRPIAGRWQLWTLASIVGVAALGVWLLVDTELLPGPEPRSFWTSSVAAIGFLVSAALAHRHLRLARIARSSGPLVVAAGYGFVGASALIWFGAAPYSVGFWLAHLLDILGVFAATIGALLVYRSSSETQGVIDPVLAVDSRAAFEIGLDPLVRRFVADLDAKDPITRDHVVRTAELAIRVGDELEMSPGELRQLGLAALLHDVGKLEIPDWILNKPSSLTDVEFETMKQHVIWGHRLVSRSPVLSVIAPAVRGHHERVDGGGYPDGLAGSDIPLHARIVSVCDAYDAMVHSRQYREGMGRDRAVEILRLHAGTQWDEDLVEIVVAMAMNDEIPESPRLLESEGRIGCDCLPGSGDGHGDTLATAA